MEPKNDGSKRNLLFQGAISRFHVKFWEGTLAPFFGRKILDPLIFCYGVFMVKEYSKQEDCDHSLLN